VGGFSAHDADDLLLTLRYRASGWDGVYVPKILARGLTPVDWPGYLRQQRRWARSVLDIKCRLYSSFAKNLSLKSRVISSLHGLNYLHRSIVILAALVLTGISLASGITPAVLSWATVEKLAVLYVVLQAAEFYRQRFYLDPRDEWGFHWRVGLLQYAKWPWFMMALLDVLAGRRMPYVITNKIKADSPPRMLLTPNLMIITFLLGAWLVGWSLGSAAHPLVYIVAATFIIGSLILIWTEFWGFPAPYSKELANGIFAQTPSAATEERLVTSLSSINGRSSVPPEGTQLTETLRSVTVSEASVVGAASNLQEEESIGAEPQRKSNA
jgi:cellulose synthase/poly-beta-1,6-N-acetylglucosamine synthase-like glycosyltransferase